MWYNEDLREQISPDAEAAAEGIHAKRVYKAEGYMIRIRKGIDLLQLMSECGYTSYQLRRGGIFGERTIQKLRRGGLPSWRELDVICRITAYQPGELVEFIDERYCGEGAEE